MIKAMLVVNEFLRGEKYDEIHSMLVAAFAKRGVRLEVFSNARLMPILAGNYSLGEVCDDCDKSQNGSEWRKVAQDKTEMRGNGWGLCEDKCEDDSGIDSGIFGVYNERGDKELFCNGAALCEYKFVLFFDKDILLARHLEGCGLRVFNSAAAIEICDDKRLTALHLDGKIKMPKTIIAPMTFENIGFNNYKFLGCVEKNIGFPLVVKEAFGSFGKQVYLVNDREQLEKCVRGAGTKLLFQQFVSSSFGTDIRVQVVGGRVVAAVQRRGKEGSFISNVTGGGSMTAIIPDYRFAKMAINACEILGIDFAGVDILIGEKGEPVLCEINSNAHFKNLFDACKVDVSECIADYILKELCLI